MQWIVVYLIFLALIIVSVGLGEVHKKGISSVFDKYKKRSANCKISSNELAVKLLEKSDLTHTEIVEINSKQTNCFSPKFNVIKFSSENFNSLSLVSLAISAKEATHAKSKHKKYFFSFRFIITPILSIISKLFIPIVLLAAILAFMFDLELLGFILTISMMILYVINIFFYFLLTLPEKKISKKAVEDLKNEDIFLAGEIEILKQILSCLDTAYFSTFLLSSLSFLNALDYEKIMSTNKDN